MRLPRKATCVALVFVVVSWHLPMHDLLAQQRQAVSTANDPTIDPVIQPVVVVLTNRTLLGSAYLDGGQPASGRTVILGKRGKAIAKTTVDEQGRFLFAGLAPGDYQLATNDSAAFVTCIAPANAPADAAKQITLSRQAMIARGQQPASVLLHPLLIGLVIAAAIVIPIAVSNNKDDAS